MDKENMPLPVLALLVYEKKLLHALFEGTDIQAKNFEEGQLKVEQSKLMCETYIKMLEHIRWALDREGFKR